jgi:hypothetical protein
MLLKLHLFLFYPFVLPSIHALTPFASPETYIDAAPPSRDYQLGLLVAPCQHNKEDPQQCCMDTYGQPEYVCMPERPPVPLYRVQTTYTLGGVDGYFDHTTEGSPQELELQRKMRKIWDNAPVRPELEGERVRLAGYVVPLEYSTGAIRDFLLVPYFGACIHTPPPPPNQIIHVNPARPLKSESASEAVWVSGVLETVRSETGMGNAGYRMRGVTVTPYRKP